MSAGKGRWWADWFVSCGVCGEEKFVDSGRGRGNQKPLAMAEATGWRWRPVTGWTCGACIQKIRDARAPK